MKYKPFQKFVTNHWTLLYMPSSDFTIHIFYTSNHKEGREMNKNDANLSPISGLDSGPPPDQKYRTKLCTCD
jgi:hypothetical protein